MKKRIITILVVLTLLLQMMPLTTFAATPAFSVSKTNVKTGEQFTVSFKHPKAQTISSYDLTVSFDKNNFEPVSIDETTAYKSVAPTVESIGNNGQIRLGYTDNSFDANTSIEEGMIYFTITFKAKETATIGSYDFRVDSFSVGGPYNEETSSPNDITPTDEEIGAKTIQVTVVSELTAPAITMSARPTTGSGTGSVVANDGEGGAKFTVDFTDWKKGSDSVSGNFEPNTEYTAIGTLTASTGYVFADTATVSLAGAAANESVEKVSVTEAGKKLTFKYKYTTPAVPTHTFAVNFSGITKEAHTEQVAEGSAYSYTPDPVAGYSFSPASINGTMSTTDVTETVIYSKLADTDIESITIVEPTKKSFEVGDGEPTWSDLGLVVKADYTSDGTDDLATLEASKYTVSGFNSATENISQTITVTANSKTDTFTISINKKTPGNDIFQYTPPASLTYDKTAKAANVEYKGSGYNDTTAGLITVTYEKDDVNVSNPTDAGTYKVYAATAGGTTYTAKAKTMVGEFTIQKATLTISGATATNRNYEKDNKNVEISAVTFNGGTLNKDDDYTVIGVMDDDNAGTGKTVNVTVTLINDNYSLATTKTTTTVDINKLTYGDQNASGSAKYGSTGTVDLSGYLKDGYVLGTITKTNETIFSDGPSMDGTSLKFTFANNVGNAGQTSNITIPVTSATNYNSYSITVTVTVNNKTVPTVTAPTAKTGLVFSGAAQNLISAGSTNGGTMQYKVGALGTYGTAIPQKTDAGTYQVFYKVVGDDDYADVPENSISVTIAKKPVTVAPKNFTITKGSAIPNFELSYDGLVGSDTLTPSAALEFKCFEADGVTHVSTTTAAGNYTITWTNEGTTTFTGTGADNYDVTKNATGTLTIKNPSSGGGGGYLPPVQKPTITSGEGVKVTLSSDGTVATIKVDAGYELVDVVLNGTSKGKVTEVKGLKTGDKLAVTAAKKAPESAEPTAEEIIATLADHKLAARSKVVTMKNGKKAVRITWYNANGEMMEFDGVEIFRSTKKNSGYGNKPFYATKESKSKGYYINTKDVKVGTTYYYKLRGYVVIDGQKYYTDYSLKAIRTVK